jgi:hypothetical protein
MAGAPAYFKLRRASQVPSLPSRTWRVSVVSTLPRSARMETQLGDAWMPVRRFARDP